MDLHLCRHPRNGNGTWLKFGQILVGKLKFLDKNQLKSIQFDFKELQIVQKYREANKIKIK